MAKRRGIGARGLGASECPGLQSRCHTVDVRQLEQAGPFDEAKVRAVATQQSQAMTELMVQKARIKSELVAVLTPDQKDKLAKLQARREARMQKHLQQQGQATTAQ